MSPRSPLIVAAVLAALLLTACSSPSPSSGGSSSPSSSPHTTAASSAAADPAHLCSLMSVTKANSVVRPDPPFTQSEEGTFVDGEPECGYASSDSTTVIVNVTLFTDISDFTLTDAVISDAALSPIDGVGDRAAVGGPELDAIVGSRGIVVESFGSTDLSKDQLVAMGKAVVAALG